MSISGIFGKSNLSRIAFIFEGPQEVYAGSTFPLTITLKNNRKLLPAFLIRLQTSTFETSFPFVDSGKEATLHVNILIKKRGLYRISDPVISSVFPFNFFTRFRKLPQMSDIIVFPSLKPCNLWTVNEVRGKTKGDGVSEKIGHEADVISIREYTRGDPLKYIHWKATAKTGKLKTKEHEAFSYEPVVIDFDKILIHNVEERLSCVAYTVVKLCKKGIPVGLKILGRFYPPDASQNHKIALLKELALYRSECQVEDGIV